MAASTRAMDAGSCIGSSGSNVQRGALRARYKHALGLVHDRHFEAALSDLRDIAVIDPGYPGINLDVSDALLQMNRTEEAKEKIAAQLAVSDCLAGLPDQELDIYCRTEVQSGPDGCRGQLAHIRQAAQYQRALVALEMERASKTESEAVAKNDAPKPPRPMEKAEMARLIANARTATPGPTLAGVANANSVVPVDTAARAAAPLVREETKLVQAAPARLTAGEAAQHVGELKTVCGSVAARHTADLAAGKPTFVDLDRPFPQQAFTVVVWDKEKEQVGDIPEHGSLCVTGKIATYRGIPQIVVHDAKDWTKAAGTSAP